jgi:antitoxin component YwqK of YwqJK toxin-antitoxin module
MIGLVCSCGEKDSETFFYKDGSVKEKIVVDSDNVLEGESYYENGVISARYRDVDGKLDGEQIKYYLNGKIKAILNYNNGVKNGEFFIYYESGMPLLKEYYVNGKLHGEKINYDENGKVFEKRIYDNGIIIKDGNYRGE